MIIVWHDSSRHEGGFPSTQSRSQLSSKQAVASDGATFHVPGFWSLRRATSVGRRVQTISKSLTHVPHVSYDFSLHVSALWKVVPIFHVDGVDNPTPSNTL